MTTTTATASGTFMLGGDIQINRMGFGAMRITGNGIWGEPEDRPEAEEDRRRDADPRPDRQPAEHPPGEPDVDRAEDGEDELAVGIEPPDRDERHEHDRRQGRDYKLRCYSG